MIKIIDGNLFDSKANFIVHQTNCLGVMGAGVALQVAEKFPHVEKEYLKYLRHCKKNKTEALGTAQYVPVDEWALVMTDTMNNTRVTAYDTRYQYIVNLFGQASIGSGMQTNLRAMTKAFEDICDKAKVIGATVAMPYMIGSFRGGANWEDVYAIIKKVFDNKVDVEIWRFDKS